MKKILAVLVACSALISAHAATLDPVVSPDGRISATLTSSAGTWYLKTVSSGTSICRVKLGLATETKNFDGVLTLLESSSPELVQESYANVHGKCSHPENAATAVIYRLLNDASDEIDVEVRAYNDGVAFRYIIPGDASETLHFLGESTTFIMAGAKQRWIQRFVTSYEEDYPLQESNVKQGDWNYPALFHYQKGDQYALLTEAGVDGNYCATHLNNSAAGNNYTVSYPFGWEGNGQGSSNPDAVTPWKSPWRLLVMGTLADVFQSTLVEDVCPPSEISDPSWIEPGGAAWIYWAYNHGSRDYQICRQYVDLAIEMGWKYVLIDWEWDVMGNGGNIEDIISYASAHGVKTMLWYNSGGTHNNVGGGPRDRLLTHESRCREFRYLKNLGVSGIKIDFFESDKQDMMKYYLDILADAADYGMLIVFHGCTVPRGWSRTYPNLMTMEAVFGAEQYNNGDIMTQIGPRLNCTLPFTRNVVGPMDYTPVAFTDSQHPHLTSFAHELALSVVFESGVQHWADRPSGFYSLPTLAGMHMRTVPVAWDESRLLQGSPGTDCVVARRIADKWYVGGINGEDTDKTYTVKLDFLAHDGVYMATIMGDGADYDVFNIRNITVTSASSLELPAISRGGFAIDIRKIAFADLAALCDKAAAVVAEAESGTQTANEALLADLRSVLEEARKTAQSCPDEELHTAFSALGDALSRFECTGVVRNGVVADIDAAQIITRHYLGEGRNFSRTDSPDNGLRFGVPRDWTVENFTVVNADIGGMGDKGGIDRYAGDNTLSLGVWNDSHKAITDISKSMIYRKITLPAGNYFFGAAYQTVSSDEAMYIYAADRALTAAEVKEHAISYHSLSESHGNGKHYGVYFNTDSERDVYLGWSGDLTTSGQKEFRAREIVLLRLDGFNDAEAIHAAPSVTVGVPEFARHLDAANSVGAEGEALLTVKDKTVEVGQVVMDNISLLTACCSNVKSPTSRACIEVYLDAGTQPIATGAYTSDTDKAAIAVKLPQITGRHNLKLKFCGAEYTLRSVTLSDPSSVEGMEGIEADPVSPACRGVYRMDGVKVSGTDLAPGLYIIDGAKTVVR